MLGLAYVVSAVLIGLVFSMAAHERRREMAVLRASGATPFFIFRTLWTEAILVAVVGGVRRDRAISTGVIYRLSATTLTGALHMPFLFPSAGIVLRSIVAALGPGHYSPRPGGACTRPQDQPAGAGAGNEGIGGTH